MSYTVTEATVVFPDKKAPSSFSTGYASKKPCAHIDCDLEGRLSTQYLDSRARGASVR